VRSCDYVKSGQKNCSDPNVIFKPRGRVISDMGKKVPTEVTFASFVTLSYVPVMRKT